METYIPLIFLLFLGIIGWLLLRKMKTLDEMKTKMEEEEKKNWDQWQTVNSQISGQIQQLTHHFQSELNQMQGNVSNTTSQLSNNIQKQMSSMTQSLDSRLNKTADSLNKVSNTHVKLAEETKSIQHIGKDIAELQRILKAPKLRGILGELSLENLLSQVYPRGGYDLQYSFKDGVIADAVLKLKDNRLLVIDSKFAYSTFNEIIKCEDDKQRVKLKRQFLSDVKKHINSISQKYILPDEGTLDFALMYIPAENIYYETVIHEQGEKNLLDYAYQHKVFPVSPNTLYAYLTTIAMGLRGLEIDKKAQLIINHLGRLSQEYTRFSKDFSVLGGHISKTRSKYEDSSKRLSRFGDKMEQMQGLEIGIKKIPKKSSPKTIVSDEEKI